MALLPNFLSSMRVGLVPVLLILAANGMSNLFLICLAVAMLTDALDGYFARRFNAASDLGAKLDSWADFATYLALPFCAWWLRPEVIRAEAAAIGAVIVFYLLPIAIGCLKFRRLTSYHTWLAKACSVCAGIVIVVFFAGGPSWPWRAFAPLIVISGLEEIAITTVLNEWRANVPTLWHALQIKRELARVKSEDDSRSSR